MIEHYVQLHFLKISESLSGQRIDNFLYVYLKSIPRTMIYRIIRTGKIRVNKKRVKFYYKLCTKDVLKIPPIKRIKIQQFPIYSEKELMYLKNSIIYEDDHLLILNKPTGIAVHNGSGLKFNIIDGLKNILYSKTQFLELVHRLDRDTSGILLIAKTRSSLISLQKQWCLRKIYKEYLALVYGIWNFNSTIISVPLSKKKFFYRNGINNIVCIDFKNGKFSQTCFRVKEYFKQLATLLIISPITGRTHQIRVHSKYAMHPIIGDNIYGNTEINIKFNKLGFNRLFLHASSLCFVHPITKKTLFIHAPIDQSFYDCLILLKTFHDSL